MKHLNKTLSLLLISTLFLSACGDKPSSNQSTQSDQQKADVVTTQADTTQKSTSEESGEDKADEVKTTTSATSDETDKGVIETDQPANADKAENAKSDTSSPVQALSLAEGKARYEKTCKICHEQGLLDAPKLTDKANWAKRLTEKDMATLYKHSAKGFNKMPAQVAADVSEAEVYAAVDYMVSQVK